MVLEEAAQGAEKLSRISDDENWSPKTAEEMST